LRAGMPTAPQARRAHTSGEAAAENALALPNLQTPVAGRHPDQASTAIADRAAYPTRAQPAHHADGKVRAKVAVPRGCIDLADERLGQRHADRSVAGRERHVARTCDGLHSDVDHAV